MNYSGLRTATLRSLFAGAYLANCIVAILHFRHVYLDAYLDALASIIVIILSLCMMFISLQMPEKLMIYFEMTGKEIVFTWRMRSVADIVQILFLVAFGLMGKIMAIVTAVLLVLVYTLAQHRPDIFRELFRAHAGDPQVGEGADDGGYIQEGGAHMT
mmetsp:Transcript_18157/g.42332  ORF Transcript_18157/g.42332 Transcript_18157/m.42332 type:complete len:158 (-) Transcript_18157:77-550(-)